MIIRLQTNPKQIEIGILNATRSSINRALHNAANGIRREIVKMVDILLQGSPEYQSLTNGILRAEFGLKDPEFRLSEILETIKNNIDVSVVPVSTIGKSLQGGVNINILKSGFEDILSLSSATYQGKNFPIPWLEWLLLQGDRIVIAGYHITYNPSPAQKRSSQSGVAVMEKGGGWRVPPQFAGTLEENWLTRTFDVANVKSLISEIVQKQIMGSF